MNAESVPLTSERKATIFFAGQDVTMKLRAY